MTRRPLEFEIQYSFCVLPGSGGYWELCIDQIAIMAYQLLCVDDRLSVYVKHLLYCSWLFPAMFIPRCIAISSSVYTFVMSAFPRY